MSERAEKLQRLADRLDAVSEWTGRATAWLAPALVLLVSYDVVMRYLFRNGSVALQELEWHLFALLFLLAAGYTLKHDAHVRVDIVYQRMSERWRAWVDLLGSGLVLLPFCMLIIVSSWPFVSNAWLFNEGSPDPGGLPYRYLIKAAIPLGFGLLAVQALADVARNLARLLPAAGHKRRAR